MTGQTLAHYTITSKLGQGGMGEVYRATDTKLDREVAIKVLPESFTQDRERLARFDREAKTLASLNHPNIASIYGLENSGGKMALVLELVEGQTLAERLRTGAMPVEEALEVCKQIAEALEAAHEKGIIHRDLKPGNVKLTPEGKVKVLDFGLAKAAVADSSVSATDNSQSPTLTADYTRPGVILGTAGYMSPEQARAKPVDKRSDNWSFGCVLFECLTGKRVFQGEDVTETLATVIKGDPDWRALPENTPATIQLLLRKCLAKDRKRRLRDIGDAIVDLEQAIADPSSSFIRLSEGALHESTHRGGNRPLLRTVGMVFACFVTAALAWFLKPVPKSEPRPIRHLVTALGGEEALHTEGGAAVRLSPDGSILAYISDPGETGGSTQIHLRELNQLDFRPLNGTEGVNEFCFSPDGTSIAFVSNGFDLKRIAVIGGTPIPLVDLRDISQEIAGPASKGLDWGDDGWIVVSRRRGGLCRIPETGGSVHFLTSPVEGEISHRRPDALPGGRAVLYTALTDQQNYDASNIMVQELKDGQTNGTPKLIWQGGYAARYLPSGHLVYEREGMLYAARFDLESLTRIGEPSPVLMDVAANGNAASHFDVSTNGTLAYVKGPAEGGYGTSKIELEWVDRQGKREPLGLAPDIYGDFSLSPDGRFLAYTLHDYTQSDIYIYEIERGFPRRLTSDPANESKPVWSPSGESLVFYSDRAESPGLYWIRREGGTAQSLFKEGGQDFRPLSWHGTNLAIRVRGEVNMDLKTASLEGDDLQGWKGTEIKDFLSTSSIEFSASFSPDGQWLAYVSSETGGFQVHVRPFPSQPVGREQVSISGNGSFWPKWSPTSQQLVFESTVSRSSRENQFYIADYRVEGGKFIPKPPVAWQGGTSLQRPSIRDYDLDPTGQRLLVVKSPDAAEQQEAPTYDHVVIIQNFTDYLRNQLKSGGK